MSHELWATYSVKDHLSPRALAADILLFDRLVFPVPEKPISKGGQLHEPGPVEWRRNAPEWDRWVGKDWDPYRQRALLNQLEPVIRKVQWDSTRSQDDEYRKESAKLAAQNVPDYAFVATRTILTRDLPAYVKGIAALGPAYRTAEEMKRELGMEDDNARRILPGGVLPVVLAWEFFAPDPTDARLSTRRLLKETVDFVDGESDFKKQRAAFVEWQQKFLRDETTDAESVKRAVKDMRELLETAKRTTDRLTIRKVVRYAVRVAPSALGLAAAFAGIPGGVEMAAGGVFLSLGSVGVDELVFKSAEAGTPPPTAFVHAAQRHFGWRERDQ